MTPMTTSPTPPPTTEDPNLGRVITFSPTATNAGPDLAGSDGSSPGADEEMSAGSIIGILIIVMVVLAVGFFVGILRVRRTKATTLMLMNDMKLQRRNSDVRYNRHDTYARRLSLELDQASPNAPPSVPKTVWTTYINQDSEPPPAGIDRENEQYVPLDSYVDIGNNPGAIMAVDGEYMQQEVEGEGVEMLLDHVTLELTKGAGAVGGVDTYVSGLDTLLNRKKSRIAIPNDPGDWGELSHRRQSSAKKAKRQDQDAFDDEQLAGLNELICRLSEEQGDGSGLTSRATSAAMPVVAQVSRFTPFSAINPGFEFEHSDMLEMEPDNDELPPQRHRRMSGDSIVSQNAGYLDPVPYTSSATPTSFATAHGPASIRNPGKLHSADRLASEVIMMDTPFWRSLPPTDPRQNQSGSAGNNLHFYPPVYPEPGATIQTTSF